MNEYLVGLILGLVQGLTEFLPVSSSGHLVLAEMLGVGAPDLAFNLFLHLATLLAVVVTYRKRLWYLVIKHPSDERVRFILIASVPTAACAAAIRFFVPQTTEYLPLCFFTTSVLLLLPDVLKRKTEPLSTRLIPKSLFVGLLQGLACFNGVSRSGSTVSALKLVGTDAEESAELSFLLSIPVILGSAVAEMALGGDFHIGGGAILGFFTAFFVGLAAIKSFVSLLKKGRTWLFSVYTAVVGIVAFFLIFAR